MTWYTGDETYDTVLLFSFGLAGLIMIGALLVQSPYGRFSSDKMGVNLSPRLGWFLMELPATLSFVFFYSRGANRFELVPLFFLLVWLIHYGNRGFVFPYLIRNPKGASASFSITIVLMGWLVTTLHGYLNSVYISALSPHFSPDWFTDPRFIIGITIYYVSFVLNIKSDAIVRNLRTLEEMERGDKVYRIPRGGLFRYVTNASYLTEITAFAGFAIATWSLGAVFILLVTVANLVPRAFANHRWYREKFDDYPPRAARAGAVSPVDVAVCPWSHPYDVDHSTRSWSSGSSCLPFRRSSMSSSSSLVSTCRLRRTSLVVPGIGMHARSTRSFWTRHFGCASCARSTRTSLVHSTWSSFTH